jgi:predicted XRE-type DNA-binding protein
MADNQIEDLKDQILKEIKKEIERKGLSQSQAGELAGMSRVNMNKFFLAP